ncbi:hypothetical protein BH10PLA1_BH10PLA1_09140 [soil metagenome]
MTQSVREQLRSMMEFHPRAEGFAATLTVGPGLSILPDHFTDQPLLPGMCMVQAVLLAAATARGADELRLRTLKTAKWMQPVAPGDQVMIEGTMAAVENGDVAIKVKLLRNDQRCAEFSLTASANGAAS